MESKERSDLLGNPSNVDSMKGDFEQQSMQDSSDIKDSVYQETDSNSEDNEKKSGITGSLHDYFGDNIHSEPGPSQMDDTETVKMEIDSDCDSNSTHGGRLHGSDCDRLAGTSQVQEDSVAFTIKTEVESDDESDLVDIPIRSTTPPGNMGSPIHNVQIRTGLSESPSNAAISAIPNVFNNSRPTGSPSDAINSAIANASNNSRPTGSPSDATNSAIPDVSNKSRPSGNASGSTYNVPLNIILPGLPGGSAGSSIYNVPVNIMISGLPSGSTGSSARSIPINIRLPGLPPGNAGSYAQHVPVRTGLIGSPYVNRGSSMYSVPGGPPVNRGSSIYSVPGGTGVLHGLLSGSSGSSVQNVPVRTGFTGLPSGNTGSSTYNVPVNVRTGLCGLSTGKVYNSVHKPQKQDKGVQTAKVQKKHVITQTWRTRGERSAARCEDNQTGMTSLIEKTNQLQAQLLAAQEQVASCKQQLASCKKQLETEKDLTMDLKKTIIRLIPRMAYCHNNTAHCFHNHDLESKMSRMTQIVRLMYVYGILPRMPKKDLSIPHDFFHVVFTAMEELEREQHPNTVYKLATAICVRKADGTPLLDLNRMPYILVEGNVLSFLGDRSSWHEGYRKWVETQHAWFGDHWYHLFSGMRNRMLPGEDYETLALREANITPTEDDENEARRDNLLQTAADWNHMCNAIYTESTNAQTSATCHKRPHDSQRPQFCHTGALQNPKRQKLTDAIQAGPAMLEQVLLDCLGASQGLSALLPEMTTVGRSIGATQRQGVSKSVADVTGQGIRTTQKESVSLPVASTMSQSVGATQGQGVSIYVASEAGQGIRTTQKESVSLPVASTMSQSVGASQGQEVSKYVASETGQGIRSTQKESVSLPGASTMSQSVGATQGQGVSGANGSGPSGAKPLGPSDGKPSGASGAKPSGAKPSGSEPSGSNPSGAKPSGSEPSSAKPPGANPFCETPLGPTPSGAKPSCSELSGAKPSVAKPSGSGLSDAKPSCATPLGPTPSGAKPSGTTPGLSLTKPVMYLVRKRTTAGGEQDLVKPVMYLVQQGAANQTKGAKLQGLKILKPATTSHTNATQGQATPKLVTSSVRQHINAPQGVSVSKSATDARSYVSGANITSSVIPQKLVTVAKPSTINNREMNLRISEKKFRNDNTRFSFPPQTLTLSHSTCANKQLDPKSFSKNLPSRAVDSTKKFLEIVNKLVPPDNDDFWKDPPDFGKKDGFVSICGADIEKSRNNVECPRVRKKCVPIATLPNAAVQETLLSELHCRNPEAKWWIKVGSIQILRNHDLRYNGKEEFIGDEDLGDGAKQQAEEIYRERKKLVQELGLGKRNTASALKQDLSKLIDFLEDDTTYLANVLRKTRDKRGVYKYDNLSVTLRAAQDDAIEQEINNWNRMLERNQDFRERLERALEQGKKARLKALRSTLMEYTTMLTTKKRVRANYVVIFMISDEMQNIKPYSWPVRMVPLETVTGEIVAQLRYQLIEKMTELKMNIVGCVKDEWTNHLDVCSPQRPVFVTQLIAEAKEEASTIHMSEMTKYFTAVEWYSSDAQTGELQLVPQWRHAAIPEDDVFWLYKHMKDNQASLAEGLAALHRKLLPDVESPHHWNSRDKQTVEDQYRALMAIYLYRRKVATYATNGVDFEHSLYVPAIDPVTKRPMHVKEAMQKVLKNVAREAKEDKNFPEEVKPRLSNLLESLYKASINKQWSAERRHEANQAMLKYVLEGWMPWVDVNNRNYTHVDVNRPIEDVTHMSEEMLTSLLINIESDNQHQGRHPWASTCQDVSLFISLLRHPGQKPFDHRHFMIPTLIQTMCAEFYKAIDPDLEFYYYWTDKPSHIHNMILNLNDLRVRNVWVKTHPKFAKKRPLEEDANEDANEDTPDED